ncbi:hypothetical protein PsYK624_026200 [Phanerochaete sordida]|uniref:Uncharacterized protein n=1 Tax=Phanerochaete sordida TaxID=48140 RepID=A0A9P3G268_9APHY|nr:hypothetical protein PsYK624_026200 [Phanerochaete sordida]
MHDYASCAVLRTAGSRSGTLRAKTICSRIQVSWTLRRVKRRVAGELWSRPASLSESLRRPDINRWGYRLCCGARRTKMKHFPRRTRHNACGVGTAAHWPMLGTRPTQIIVDVLLFAILHHGTLASRRPSSLNPTAENHLAERAQLSRVAPLGRGQHVRLLKMKSMFYITPWTAGNAPAVVARATCFITTTSRSRGLAVMTRYRTDTFGASHPTPDLRQNALDSRA